MKRITLVAALTAIAGAASAQSNVTLFGLIDLSVNHYAAGGKSGAGSVWKMNDGTVNGLNGSRWGIRTSEDLGGGIRIGTHLEAGVNVDTGTSAQGGRAFGRQIFVSLASKDAGEVRLGRQYVLSDSVVGAGNPYGNGGLWNPTTSVTNAGKNLPMFLNASRADNVVQYETPALGPVKLAGQIAPGEGTADRFHGLRAVYSASGLYVGATYEWGESRTTKKTNNKSISASANYDFGSFKIKGGLQRNSDLATGSGNGAAVGVSSLVVTGTKTFAFDKSNGWTLGAELPVGAFTYAANYTRMNFDGANGNSDNLGKIAAGGWYALSKSTLLYADVSFATGGLKDYISEKTVYQAGIRTSF
ncbi:Porin_4 domain-containing protein [Rubrivivax sp. A210]|uniref:porin n=1 Tax=Rubrivivax sp. A210 TaxID=2772301 RepID=UPI001918C72B|nr:porin [Rubrivivax sp. A210]CAD5373501.1 Porin_4 domain-containing protein [Rubrivivax sp. A210]